MQATSNDDSGVVTALLLCLGACVLAGLGAATTLGLLVVLLAAA